MPIYTLIINLNGSVDRMELTYSGVIQYHIKLGFLILYLESGRKTYLALSTIDAFTVEVVN